MWLDRYEYTDREYRTQTVSDTELSSSTKHNGIPQREWEVYGRLSPYRRAVVETAASSGLERRGNVF